MNANVGHNDKSTEIVIEPIKETPSKRMVTSDVSTATSSMKHLVKPHRSEDSTLSKEIHFIRFNYNRKNKINGNRF